MSKEPPRPRPPYRGCKCGEINPPFSPACQRCGASLSKLNPYPPPPYAGETTHAYLVRCGPVGIAVDRSSANKTPAL
jgi:hypothetical protein